jgi:apolipoprotein N-acyltransferase
MYLSFPSYDIIILKGFPFFAWIALVPLFLYVRGKNAREVFISSFITGLAGNFLAFEWIGHFGAAAPGGYPVIVSFLMPALSVFFSMKILAAEFFSRRFESLRPVIYPSIWIFVDWIESIGYLAYPLPYWGYSQYPLTPLIQMASFTGIMGITFVIIIFNYLVADLARSRGFLKMPIGEFFRMKEARRLAAGIVFIVSVMIYGTISLVLHDKPIKKDLRIAMVQSCISPWENWNINRFHYLAELKRYTRAAIDQEPDCIIWSESATLETISYDYERGSLNDFEKDAVAVPQSYDRPLLTGEIGVVEEYADPFLRRYPQNNAVMISRFGEVVKSYSKIHLVPFGEWFPYEKWFPFVKRITESFGGSSFVPGKKPVLFNISDRNFGALICYEGIFFRLCRKYRNMGADFFVNITNDGWTDTFRGHMQHFSASKFRAVENGIWYLRAGNTGYTVFIDPYGRIRNSIPILKKGYLVGDIDFSLNHETVYSVIGDLFLYIAMAFIGALAIIFSYEKIKFMVERKYF